MRFAPILALLAFAYVCVSGASNGGAFVPVTEQALAALFIFWIIGAVVGPLGEQVVTERLHVEIEEEIERGEALTQDVTDLIQNKPTPAEPETALAPPPEDLELDQSPDSEPT
ncbi:MAG: hypothetical protein QF752_03220 [Planctomycetota bacterium]|jgi:hypothetical protein|nr:hypothetical protein [Planctomycetota bacterium]